MENYANKLTVAEVVEYCSGDLKEDLKQRGIEINDVSIKTIHKNNDDYTGIVLIGEDKVCPTFYAENMCDYTSYDEIADYVASVLKKPHISFSDENDIYTDFNCFRLFICNTERNEEFLKTVPHKEVLDMSIYLKLCKMEDECCASLVVDDKVLKDKNITFDEAYQQAEAYLSENLDILNLSSFLISMGILPTQLNSISEEELPLYVTSTQDKFYGAAILGNCELLNRVCEKMGEDDIYIIPSSIHKILTISTRIGDPKFITSLICDVNNNEVSPQEILSYNLYHYNSVTNELSCVTID